MRLAFLLKTSMPHTYSRLTVNSRNVRHLRNALEQGGIGRELDLLLGEPGGPLG